MKKVKCLVILFCLTFLSVSAQAIEIFPLSEVKPGLIGVGKTVVQGTTVEEFVVEVIGVIPQSPPTPNLIMVRVSGDPIDKSGGIASGMSGSPVYIDGKLLGAIGYGYSYTDHRIGLVTPAEEMLKLLDVLEKDPEPIEQEWQIETRSSEHFIPLEKENIPSEDSFIPLNTPLMIGGISGRSFKYLEKELSQYDFRLIQGLTGSSTSFLDEGIELEPGSAFGVQLLRGDFQATAFGTITYIKDNEFVGFGHPFTHRGDVEFFVTPAVVHYTLAHVEFPFKVASSGPNIGTLYQDRAAGVAGKLNNGPSYVPIFISVEDKDRELVLEYKVEAVKDEAYIHALAISSAFQGIDATLDRIGRGTAEVTVEFVASNLSNTIIRDNMFFSESDIAVWALLDLEQGLDLLLTNRFQEVDLTQINIIVSVENERRTAVVERAIPQKYQVAPGDVVDVEVTIRPHRQEVETLRLQIMIPPETAPGMLTVTVRGGGYGYYYSKPSVHTSLEFLSSEEEIVWEAPSSAENLDKLLEEYMNGERYNELVAEFYPFFDDYDGYFAETENGVMEMELDHNTIPETPEIEEQQFSMLAVEEEQSERGNTWESDDTNYIRVRKRTPYVIEGLATFDLEIITY